MFELTYLYNGVGAYNFLRKTALAEDKSEYKKGDKKSGHSGADS
jgi:hypothetical protein